MALPSKYGIDKKTNSMEGLSAYENGGKGSGNFGHVGRPGEIGGSASEGGATGLAKAKEIAKDDKQWQKLLGDIAERAEQIKSDTGGRGTLEGTLAYEKIPKKIIDTLDLTNNPTSSQAQAIAEVLAKEGITGKPEKAKTEREEHIKQIDKIIGSEKITEGKTKAEDDKNYKKLEKDIREIKKILAKEKSRENFGQEEIRKLRDKYSDYMSGNWSVTERFQRSMRDFEDWADNYVNNSLENVITDAVIKALNGGKGSGNFGHSGRPGEVGGSSSGGFSSGQKVEMTTSYGEKLEVKIIRKLGDKEKQDRAFLANPNVDYYQVETPDGGKSIVWEGRLKYTDAKEKDDGGKYAKRKDYKTEQKGVDVRDGHSIGTEFADLEAQLSTARTNLKMLQKDSGKAYDDLAGRNRYLARQSEIARAFSQARALGKSKLSTETKKLVKEMETELRSIMADYTDLGTKKYFNPDLNVER